MVASVGFDNKRYRDLFASEINKSRYSIHLNENDLYATTYLVSPSMYISRQRDAAILPDRVASTFLALSVCFLYLHFVKQAYGNHSLIACSPLFPQTSIILPDHRFPRSREFKANVTNATTNRK